MTPATIGLAFLILMMGIADLSLADDQPFNANEESAIEWLREQVEFFACDETHYIYGVGYIDGSYMERIFLVADERGKPHVEAEFREAQESWQVPGSDLSARSFIIELSVPRALYAQKSNPGWHVGHEGWETALRFKYTTWFGMLSRVDRKWQVKWQGYRRPMLPADLRNDEKKVCSWFDLH